MLMKLKLQYRIAKYRYYIPNQHENSKINKITKKPTLLPLKVPKAEQQIELIKCLEGQEIKLVEERKEKGPIVIPMKENGKTSAALASLMKRRAVLMGQDYENPALEKSDQTKLDVKNIDDVLKSDTEKRVVREIIAELEESTENVDAGLVLPILKPEELPLDGAKESNLDDYESIPVEQFGLAMLRGMGWKEPSPLSQKKKALDEVPMVRPKGMGLGADKALKAKPLLVQPESSETLEIKKQAYVRILGGKYKDAYGQIEGFDDHAGRVIVKMAIGGAREAFNEFLCQPVSKKEFSQYGKCINSAKYEEYKRLKNDADGQIVLEKDEKSIELKLEREKVKAEIYNKTSTISTKDNNEKSSSNQQYDEYPARSSIRDRTRSKSRTRSPSRKHSSRKDNDKKHSGSASEDSDTDSEYERKHHKKSKSKSHKKKSKKSKSQSKHRDHSAESRERKLKPGISNSDETDDIEQRDRHKHKKNKKKTKKSKRQRSRTPSRHRR